MTAARPMLRTLSLTRALAAAASCLALALACRSADPAPAVATLPDPPPPPEGCGPVLERAAAAGYRVADHRPLWFEGRPSPGEMKGRAGVSDFVIAYTVDSVGRVDSATVAASANTASDFPKALRRAAVGWHFRPAKLQGCAVPYTVVDTVRIRIGPAH